MAGGWDVKAELAGKYVYQHGTLAAPVALSLITGAITTLITGGLCAPFLSGDSDSLLCAVRTMITTKATFSQQGLAKSIKYVIFESTLILTLSGGMKMIVICQFVN